MNDHNPWKIALLIDDDVITNPDLTWTERLVYSYVQGWVRNNKVCFASSKTIAKRFNFSESHVRAARARLVKKGLLRRVERDGQLYFTTAIGPHGIVAEPITEEKTEQNQVYENRTPPTKEIPDVSKNVQAPYAPAHTDRTPQRTPPYAPAYTYNNIYNNNNNTNYNKPNVTNVTNVLNVSRFSKLHEVKEPVISEVNEAAEKFGLKIRFKD